MASCGLGLLAADAVRAGAWRARGGHGLCGRKMGEGSSSALASGVAPARTAQEHGSKRKRGGVCSGSCGRRIWCPRCGSGQNSGMCLPCCLQCGDGCTGWCRRRMCCLRRDSGKCRCGCLRAVLGGLWAWLRSGKSRCLVRRLGADSLGLSASRSGVVAAAMGMQDLTAGVIDAWRCSEGRWADGLAVDQRISRAG
jgi:hypothetical protein